MRLRSYTNRPSDSSEGSPRVDQDARLRASLLGNQEINQVQADQIAVLQERTGSTFGEAAIELGFLSRAAIDDLLPQQSHGARALASGTFPVSRAVVAVHDGFDPLSERLRALRAVVITPAQMTANPPRIIVITGVDCDDSPGIASNFAVVVAQLGYDGLLVDASVTQPSHHRLFGLDNDHGVSTLLVKGSQEARFVKTAVPHLDLLPSGPGLTDLSETFERNSLCQALRNIRHGYRFIIIDGGHQPPAIAAALARGSDGVLIVAERGRTQLKHLKQAIAQMEAREINVLGTILAR